MSDLLTKYDQWLANDGPAALVIREYLMSVEGSDGVLFPSTFAPSTDGKFSGGYNINTFSDGKNICLIDSVGSQANRMEPLFGLSKYAGLVPQIVIEAGTKCINLLDAGHRAGDAIVRCSELQQELQNAFKGLLQGNSEPLAKSAPTSIVFGAWDSRDTQAKLPRLVSSTIRAFDVREITRSAAYIPPVDYRREELIDSSEVTDTEKDPRSQRGFLQGLASWKHGGVIANGGVRRDASLHLAALRLLTASDDKKTPALRRYVLGLALTAFTYPPSGYLRQGCNLVRDPDKPREFSEVYGDGRRVPTAVIHDEALNYAKATAAAFGIGNDRKIKFDKEKAKADIGEVSGKEKKKQR